MHEITCCSVLARLILTLITRMKSLSYIHNAISLLYVIYSIISILHILQRMSQFSGKVCVICRKSFEDSVSNDEVRVSAKGLRTLISFCEISPDTDLLNYLITDPTEVNVHEKCRKRFTDKRKTEKSQPNSRSVSPELKKCKSLRSFSDGFDWKRDCFLCGKFLDDDDRHPVSRSTCRQVRTLGIRDRLLDLCNMRSDKWSTDVQSRLQMCSDLVAVEAVYHSNCHVKFVQRRELPSQADVLCGRPEDGDKSSVFQNLCEWLETADGELHTLEEFHRRMAQLTGSSETVYSMKHIRRKLEEKYGSHITFNTSLGKKTIICFSAMASTIINDKWYSERKTSAEDDSVRIVTAAANLIKSNIRQTLLKTDEYPGNRIIEDQSEAMKWVPDLLLTFMQTLVGNDLKATSISHCVVQAVRPRSVISPVLFGLGVSLDHAFGSKWLLNVLAKLGFCSSWDEVYRFRQSVVQCSDEDLPDSDPLAFTQFAGDNVDHNLATLDGCGTFHGMGMISMTVPYSRNLIESKRPEKCIKRLQRVRASEIVEGRNVPIVQFTNSEISALSKLKFESFDNLRDIQITSPYASLDLVWHTGFLFTELEKTRPGWLGFMQSSCTAPEFPAVADIRLLPMIDRSPSDMTTIYSTVCFLHKQAERLGIEPAVITFDQPLWLKATEIVLSKDLNVVCRLGGFHVLMNYLGSLGSIMSGSGLQEALECCYGPNAITHILTGKKYNRAMRAHFLVDSALHTLLLRRLFSSARESESATNELQTTSVIELENLYKDVLAGNVVLGADTPDCLVKLHLEIEKLKLDLCSKSRTAKLWIQYLDFIQVLKTFLCAERTSDWHLHLSSLSHMVPIFAAAGHSNYAKCSRLYLQMMMKLTITHPSIYDKFVRCKMHTVRRSDRFWAGISTDMAIEQVYMRSVKSRGGLTHGRGLSDSVRLMWIQTMHSCAAVHSSLLTLTDMDGSRYNSHHELGATRIRRDCSDVLKVVHWFEEHNPFAEDDGKLRSLASGVAASDSDNINCDEAEMVGRKAMLKFDDLAFSEAVLRKSDRVVALSTLTSKLTVSKKHIQMDANVLFTRLLFIMQRQDVTDERSDKAATDDIEQYFSYELTPLPTALFLDGCLRKSSKSLLAHELHNSVATNIPPTKVDAYVVDGGYLLHKVKWKVGSSYGQVIYQYVSYLRSRFSGNVTIVFDGYGNGPTVKDHEHTRRARKSSPAVVFDDLTVVYKDQEAFLANEENKTRFLHILSQQLLSNGYDIHQATSDADTDIVRIALEIADRKRSVVVIANDTDVLVILLHHFNDNMGDIVMQYEAVGRGGVKVVSVSIREIRLKIGDKAAYQILCVHAMTGCDTTSSLFGHGKVSVWRQVMKSQATEELTNVIGAPDASCGDVLRAGLELLNFIYGGRFGEKLNRLRYLKYMNMLASSMSPKSDRLPPTENAAKYHIFRAHFQVAYWKSLGSTCLNAEEWGWSVVNGLYMPVASDLPPAPDKLLKVIHCKCQMLTGRACSTRVCTCRKHGLPCVAACKNCNGRDCENVDNSPVAVAQNEETEDETDINETDVGSDEATLLYSSLDIPWIAEEEALDMYSSSHIPWIAEEEIIDMC